MQVLITGGGGFLGSHLAERYLNEGHRVVAVDNFCTGLRTNKVHLMGLSAAENLKFIEADVIQTWDDWAKQISGKVDLVLHFASPASPPHYQRLGLETMWVNTLGLSRALSFADQQGARVVFASTSEIYGDPEVSPQPETYWGNVNTMGPRSCYDEAKRFGEALIYTHNLRHKTKHGLVRIFNTYGPRMNPNDGRVIINFLIQALEGSALSIYGDGSQTRSFCFVDDLVDGIVRYAQTDLIEPVNLGNDKEFTILEAAELVVKIFSNKNLKKIFEPLPKDDPKQRKPDLTRAKNLLKPWSPKISLEEGLRQMLTALQKNTGKHL
jgi:nucleoside-diphosphate-sugar epimerase